MIYRKASKEEGIMPLHKCLGREGASGTSDKIFDSSIIKKLDSNLLPLTDASASDLFDLMLEDSRRIYQLKKQL